MLAGCHESTLAPIDSDWSGVVGSRRGGARASVGAEGGIITQSRGSVGELLTSTRSQAGEAHSGGLSEDWGAAHETCTTSP